MLRNLSRLGTPLEDSLLLRCRLSTECPRKGSSVRRTVATPGNNLLCQARERKYEPSRPAVSTPMSHTSLTAICRWMEKPGLEWLKPKTREIRGSWYGRDPALQRQMSTMPGSLNASAWAGEKIRWSSESPIRIRIFATALTWVGP